MSDDLNQNKQSLKDAEKAADGFDNTLDDLSNKSGCAIVMENLTNKIKQQKTDLENLRKEYASAVLEYGQFSDEAETIGRQISELSDNLNQNQQTLKSTEKSFEAAEKAADAFDNTLDENVSAIDKLSNEIKQQESDLKSLRQEHANAVIKYGKNQTKQNVLVRKSPICQMT